jgi:hypothetical protein
MLLDKVLKNSRFLLPQLFFFPAIPFTASVHVVLSDSDESLGYWVFPLHVTLGTTGATWMIQIYVCGGLEGLFSTSI